jgi:small subunit ribosomal protein S15
MDTATKAQIIEEYGLKRGDTGSSDVQIAILTSRIKELTEHLKMHPKDHHTRRGLKMMVEQRKKHMKYLNRTAHDRYRELIKRLGIRG